MGTGAVRYLNTPRALQVETDDQGRPCALIDGRRRAVSEIREDWLIDDRWWTDAPISRHYFELCLDGGRIAIIYRENGTWHAY